MITTPATAKPQRAVAIDYFKSYLVIGMVLAHTIALLYRDGNDLTSKSVHAIVIIINLVSFSGFFFCFGYVNYQTYLSRPWEDVWKKISWNALRLLGAYYISAFASAILLSNFKFEGYRMLRILCFTEMPAYSEFLLAFFLVTLLTLLLFRFLKHAAQTSWALITIIVVSLLSTFIPYQLITSNQAGLLIGSNKFIGFPVLQYLCYFIAGILCSKKGIKPGTKLFICSLLISVPFVLAMIVTRHLPTRFPPGILWITGPAFLLYLYYYFSVRSEAWFGRESRILSIGHQTLFYLIQSNLFLFALAARFKGDLLTNAGNIFLIYLFVMFAIYYLSKQAKR